MVEMLRLLEPLLRFAQSFFATPVAPPTNTTTATTCLSLPATTTLGGPAPPRPSPLPTTISSSAASSSSARLPLVALTGTSPPHTPVLATLLIILLCAVLYICYDLCHERRVEAAIEFMYKKEVVRHALTRRQHRRQLRAIRKQARILRHERLHLKSLLEQTTSHLSDAKKKHDEAQKSSLSQLKTAQDRVSSLEVQVNTRTKAENQAKSELKATRSRLQSVESKLVQADSDFQNAKDKIQSGGTHLADTKDKLNRANEKLTRANDKLKTVESREIYLLTDNEALKKERAMIDKASDDLESKLLEEQQEKDKLRDRLSTSESQLKISKTQQLCLRTTIDSLQKDRAKFLNRKTELEDNVLEEQQAKQKVQSKLRNEIDTSAKLKDELTSAKQCNVNLKADLENSEDALSNVEEELRSAQAHNEEYEACFKTYQRRLQVLGEESSILFTYRAIATQLPESTTEEDVELNKTWGIDEEPPCKQAALTSDFGRATVKLPPKIPASGKTGLFTSKWSSESCPPVFSRPAPPAVPATPISATPPAVSNTVSESNALRAPLRDVPGEVNLVLYQTGNPAPSTSFNFKSPSPAAPMAFPNTVLESKHSNPFSSLATPTTPKGPKAFSGALLESRNSRPPSSHTPNSDGKRRHRGQNLESKARRQAKLEEKFGSSKFNASKWAAP